MGGPDGGEGGKGGDITVRGDAGLATLLDYSYRDFWEAERGEHGMGSNKSGRGGASIVMPVPLGTVVRDLETGEVVGEILEHGEELLVAKGGRGGKGNSFFATATHQSPREWQPGEEGQQRTLELELKLIADVGLVGQPNAGKSTLLSVISAARPKIADYPFTTLSPNLGVVQLSDHRTFVVADIPGIIEGRARGEGTRTAVPAAHRADADARVPHSDRRDRLAGGVRSVARGNHAVLRGTGGEAALRGVHETRPARRAVHAGDRDAGGVRSLLDLRARTDRARCAEGRVVGQDSCAQERGGSGEGRDQLLEARRVARGERGERRETQPLREIGKGDIAFPQALRELTRPPESLFTLGDETILRMAPNRLVAIVGTRDASPYGMRVAAALAESFTAAGVGVVSGLARGIDSAAHRAALQAGGKTIAVMGTGVDVPYPVGHRGLHAEIASKGLVISENEPGTPAVRGCFPRRNRIIAGLARVTIVVEAPYKSGAINTATQALESNRVVAAIPGPIDSPRSAGSNLLLRDGAQVIHSIDDALMLFGLSSGRKAEGPTLGAAESALWEALAAGPVPVDQLTSRSGLGVRQVLEAIARLELAGLVHQRSGGSIERATLA